MKRSIVTVWAFAIGVVQLASCSVVSLCDTVYSEHPAECDPARSPLQVSCPDSGRIQIQGDEPLQLSVAPNLTVREQEGAANPPVLVSAQLPGGLQVNLSESSVVAPDKVQLVSRQELGTEPGPVHFTLTRGRWRGESQDSPALACRLYRTPSLDAAAGHSNSYPRQNVPWQGMQVRNFVNAVAVQIGTSAGGRSVLVTEEGDAMFPGRWLERYTLSSGTLAANLDPADAVWKPLRAMFGSEIGIQTAHSKNGLIVYGSAGLDTISLKPMRSPSGVMISPSAQLAASVDRDWFLLGDSSSLTGYRFDGSTVRQLDSLAIATKLLAMRAARRDGSDEPRAFDAAVVSESGTVSVLRLVGDQLKSVELPGLSALGQSATWVLASIAGPAALAIGDLDGDGLQDLIVYDNASQNILYMPQSGAESTAEFQLPLSTGLTVAGVQSLAVGDVDGDNKLDIAVVAGKQATVYLQR